jgi:hypothetical protein
MYTLLRLEQLFYNQSGPDGWTAAREAMIVNCVMSLDYICYTFYMHSTYI